MNRGNALRVFWIGFAGWRPLRRSSELAGPRVASLQLNRAGAQTGGAGPGGGMFCEFGVEALVALAAGGHPAAEAAGCRGALSVLIVRQGS
jgi:hypothetical protein